MFFSTQRSTTQTNTKWVFSPPISRTAKSNPFFKTSSSHHLLPSKSKHKPLVSLENDATLPSLGEKVVLGTNKFTQTKSMEFLKYRLRIESQLRKEEKRKKEEEKKLKFDLNVRDSVCENDKINFTRKTTNTRTRVLEDFKAQMSSDDKEFERKIVYDERIYEENMREKRTLVENLQSFDESPDLMASLSQYKYEFYKKRGFKTNNFNLAVDKDDFSLEEFSVLRQLNRKNYNQAELMRKKIVFSPKREDDGDRYENYKKHLTEKLEKMNEKPSSSYSELSSARSKLKRKITKKQSNRNFLFWLDLNKSQRILLKMKNFLAKLVKLKIPLPEVSLYSCKNPFQRPNSREFISLIKEGNIKNALELFQTDRFLVYEFDQTNQTALHWACKRGYDSIVQFLLDNNSDPNARDIVDRNPLYYAVRGKHFSIVKILLHFGALPWSTRNCDFSKLDTLLEIKKLLKRAKLAHIGVAIAPKDKKERIWKEESRAFLSLR